VRIKYCFREANKCADALIRKGLNSNKDFILFDSPPINLCILLLLFYDNSRLFYERLWPLHSPSSVFTPKIYIYIYIYMTHFIPLIFDYYPVNLAIYMKALMSGKL